MIIDMMERKYKFKSYKASIITFYNKEGDVLLREKSLIAIGLAYYYRFINKPSKEDLLPAINEAFEYYRTGSEGNPPVYVYFVEYPEDFVSY